ncbi:MAG: nucleotidyltransferase family protein [Acidobacteria bacterium]|nr:nucleotidyltransferase family protein [Acidobacteriota bacterium]
MKIAGVILAAGQSRRMGRPKALLDWRGDTVLGRMTGLLGAVCEPLIVVLGYHAEDVGAAAGRAIRVLNPNPEQGMLSSLQCGLRAVPGEADAVFFTPVDYPGIQPHTVEALAAALRASPAPLALPVCGGRRGHPVAIRRALIEEILALPAGAQPREAIHRHLDQAVLVEVADPGILEDIDDPESYARLREAETRG